MLYQITVRGNIGDHVTTLFPEIKTTRDGEYSIITGHVRSQARLHDILTVIRDLNVPLVNLECIDER